MRILTLITALGALQGALLLLCVLFRERHPKTTPLALLLLVFSARLATIPTWNAETLASLPWIYPLTAPLPFLFGFLLWWYARELSHDGSARPKPLFVHFLPWLAETAAVAWTVLGSSPEEFRTLVESIFAGTPPIWLPARNAFKVALNLVYVVLTARIAFGRASSGLAAGRRVRLRSLVILPTGVLAFFAYVAVAPGATERLAEGSPAPFVFLAAAMAMLIYAVSFLQLVMPEVTGRRGALPDVGREPLCTEEECRRLTARMERSFEDGSYRDPDLTVRELASRIGVNANRLSYAVNRTAGVSFRVLLNRRRLKHFIEMSEENRNGGRSILDMAFDAGFPSKSTFNRVFKDEYGTTPSAYIRKSRT